MARLKVVQFGVGHLGKWHLQKIVALKEYYELVGVVDPVESSRTVAQEVDKSIKTFSSVQEVDADFDTAIIVTPTKFHFSLAVDLINKGVKNLFIEKPVTENLTQALELSELSSDVFVQIGHSERCHQAWEILRNKHPDLLDDDSIVEITRYAPFKGRATDVDVVADLMIHDADLMLYLFNEYPTFVSAKGLKVRTDKNDHVVADFEFSSGRRVRITAGRSHVEEIRKINICSSKGTLQVDMMTNSILWADAKGTGEIESIDYLKRDHLMEEHLAFCRCSTEGKQSVVSMDDGLKAMKVLDGITRSIEENKRISL